MGTREITPRTAMTKAAINKQNALFISNET